MIFSNADGLTLPTFMDLTKVITVCIEENIPYEETKNYVIKVFRSYWNYTRIYQKG